MKVKLCGLFRDIDIDYANAAMPDYIGFVFAGSKRQVTPGQAKAMKARLNPAIKAVGVFVDASVDEIIALCEAGTIDLVQLHGHEDQAYIDALKAGMDVPVIKAMHGEDVQSYTCEYYLLDGAVAGSGHAFDWRKIKTPDKPFFLAGGIGPDNVQEAMKTGAYAIDLSSGIETGGVKDPKKMIEIVRAAR